jgi:membrane protease YdiL (CAAX protease family)
MDITIAGQTVPLAALILMALVVLALPVGCRYLWRMFGEVRRTGGWVSTASVIPADLIGAAMLVLLFAFFLIGNIFATMLMDPDTQAKPPAGATLAPALMQVALYLFIAGLINISMIRRGTRLVTFLGLDKPPLGGRAFKGAVILLASFPVVLLVNFCWQALLAGLGVELKEQDPVAFLRESGSPIDIVVVVFLAVIVAPLGEELVFRGYLLPVAKRFIGRWPAILSTGVFFGLIHGNWAAAVALAVLGVLLALAYEHTGSLATPIVMHMLFNATTVVILLVSTMLPEEVTEPVPAPIPPTPAPAPGFTWAWGP